MEERYYSPTEIQVMFPPPFERYDPELNPKKPGIRLEGIPEDVSQVIGPEKYPYGFMCSMGYMDVFMSRDDPWIMISNCREIFEKYQPIFAQLAEQKVSVRLIGTYQPQRRHFIIDYAKSIQNLEAAIKSLEVSSNETDK